MGGMGSGWHWCWGAKDTTDDYRSIGVRCWKQDGLLTPHQSFVCQWSRQGEVVSAIHVRTEPGRVLLTYRHRSGGKRVTTGWHGEQIESATSWAGSGIAQICY